MKLDFGLKLAWFNIEITCDAITSSHKHQSSDGGMMWNLLTIPWTAVNPALKCFAQNWIEGLFNSEVEDRVGDSKGNDLGEFLKDRFMVEVFEKFWGVWHTEKQALDVALCREDVDGETDVEDAFAWEDVFTDFC